jgi:hypothetical protein
MNLAKLIALSELPRHLPVAPNGKRYGRSTVYRWTTVGIRNHKLKYVQVGGRRYVDPIDLAEFFERLQRPIAVQDSKRFTAAVGVTEAAEAGTRLKYKYFARQSRREN